MYEINFMYNNLTTLKAGTFPITNYEGFGIKTYHFGFNQISTIEPGAFYVHGDASKYWVHFYSEICNGSKVNSVGDKGNYLSQNLLQKSVNKLLGTSL